MRSDARRASDAARDAVRDATNALLSTNVCGSAAEGAPGLREGSAEVAREGVLRDPGGVLHACCDGNSGLAKGARKEFAICGRGPWVDRATRAPADRLHTPCGRCGHCGEVSTA